MKKVCGAGVFGAMTGEKKGMVKSEEDRGVNASSPLLKAPKKLGTAAVAFHFYDSREIGVSWGGQFLLLKE